MQIEGVEIKMDNAFLMELSCPWVFLAKRTCLKKAIHFFQTAKTVLNVTKSFILSLQHHRGKHVWCEIKSTLIVFIPFQQHRNQRVVRIEGHDIPKMGR